MIETTGENHEGGSSSVRTGGLRRRLVTSHLVIAAVGIGLLAVTMAVTATLRRQVLFEHQRRAPAVQDAMQICAGLQRSLAGSWGLSKDEDFRQERQAAWQQQIDPSLKELQALQIGLTDEDRRDLDEAERILQRLKKSQREIETAFLSSGKKPIRSEGANPETGPDPSQADRQLLVKRVLSDARRAERAITGFVRRQSQLMEDEHSFDVWLSNLALWLAGFLAVGMSLVAIVLSRRNATQIARPIVALRNAARRIAAGQVTEPVTVTTDDEIGELARSFDSMRIAIERENRFRAVMASSLDPMITINCRGIVQSASDSVEIVFGWQPDELVGRNINLLIPDPHHSQHDGYLRRYLADGISRIMGQPREVRGLRRDGSTFPCEVTINRVDIPGAREPVFAGIARDITERKQTEREREDLSNRLVEASREAGKAEVATGVLHNVGNVLNSVNVTANRMTEMLQDSRVSGLVKTSELLQQHPDDLAAFLTRNEKGRQLTRYLAKLASQLVNERDALSEELAELTENVSHIKEIISMQQSFSRVSGTSQIVDPCQVMDDAIGINLAGLQRHGAELVRDSHDDLPALETDRHKVLQILTNLVSNAKYAVSESEVREKKITVRTRSRDGAIVFEVIDTGVGIATEHLSKIFSLGFTTKPDGHGYGLHASALAAKELGGSLSVHSSGRGQGARFTLTIPFAADEQLQESTETAACSA